MVCGVAFQSLKHDDAENIGYVIPTPVITHFVRDYELNGKYTGFPALGCDFQKLENADLKRSKKVPEGESGVLLRKVGANLKFCEIWTENRRCAAKF